ncbi:uncharacterized protein N7511_009815 [Penicillium nucicola]|uniref:uncharacterized protein n=1 Tax=Penicillium nucicola TaxID=1850975 RepID=UPI00254505B6|nr:uncharacterized protein N7511_009815 [Penicillium nucicola]KAJ5748119.1 hypothetical protein N7511_009815 [Penicillium nucicola]
MFSNDMIEMAPRQWSRRGMFIRDGQVCSEDYRLTNLGAEVHYVNIQFDEFDTCLTDQELMKTAIHMIQQRYAEITDCSHHRGYAWYISFPVIKGPGYELDYNDVYETAEAYARRTLQGIIHGSVSINRLYFNFGYKDTDWL